VTYYINRILPIAFDEVVTRTKAALKAEGFGVLTEINVQETLLSSRELRRHSYCTGLRAVL
jgi:uncharacterized protein (DUF302 family)